MLDAASSSAEKAPAPKTSRRFSFRAKLIATVLLLIALAAYWLLCGGRGAPRPKLTFDDDSAKLARTQIVPTLDTPMEPGKNVIWCATFLAGWKQLAQKVTNGPVQVAGADEVCARLNGATDPATYLPPSSYYANAGTEDKGILDTIEEDMAKQFPEHQMPDLTTDTIPGSFVFYSYLEMHIPFPIPYFDNRKPLDFTDSAGQVTPIRSFGVRREDGDRFGNLRRQVRILMLKYPEGDSSPGSFEEEPSSFAVDLCWESSPSQIIVARVERKDTLAATIEATEQAITEHVAHQTDGKPSGLGGNDVLLVPDMFWRFAHHFSELEHRSLGNPALAGQGVTIALQEIQLRLDRSGAELFSEAHSRWASGGPVDYVLDRPFLLYIKLRGAAAPFFVMWVNNAELLQKWESE